MLNHFSLLGNSYHVVNIFPVVECDQLEGCQHGPEQVVETGESVVRIPSDASKAHKPMGAGPDISNLISAYNVNFYVHNKSLHLCFS